MPVSGADAARRGVQGPGPLNPSSIFCSSLSLHWASVWRTRSPRCRSTQGSSAWRPWASWPRGYPSYGLSPSPFSHPAHHRAAADNRLTGSAAAIETARASSSRRGRKRIVALDGIELTPVTKHQPDNTGCSPRRSGGASCWKPASTPPSRRSPRPRRSTPSTSDGCCG